MRGLGPRAALRDGPRASDGYTKIRPLGQGAFGSVFLVKMNASGEARVLKEIKLHGLSPKDVESTQREVSILRKIQHPNIVKFYSSSIERNYLHIIMEHAGGGDLSKLIATHARARTRIPEPVVLRILAEVAGALAYCHHSLKLLHRDLKPANILLASDGRVLLCDFGVSKVLSASAALASTQCGTPIYMSPELCAGKAYDRASDIWSLGCVLYELMSLRPPWVDQLGPHGAAGGLAALLRKICSSSLSFAHVRQHYSAELADLLAALLAKLPAERPALAAVLTTPMVMRALPAPPPTSTAAATDVTDPAGGSPVVGDQPADKPDDQPADKPAAAAVAAPAHAPAASQAQKQPPPRTPAQNRLAHSPYAGPLRPTPNARPTKPSRALPRPPSAPINPTKPSKPAKPPAPTKYGFNPNVGRPESAAPPETLLQQQHRLAAAAGGVLRPEARVPFQPLRCRGRGEP